jgi:hypothetical protein
MRLLCEKVFVVGLALTMGCHDTTAPPAPNSRLYILESIRGQPLPTIASAGAGDTVTMLWSTITLDPVGNAVEVVHRRQAYLTFPAEETTYAQRYEYRITGDSITVGSFQRCVDLCASNRVGLLSDSTIALTVGYNPYPLNPTIYLYRLVKTY